MRSSGSSRTLTKAAQTESAPGRQEMARSIRHETIFAGMAAALFSLLSFDYCYSHKLLLLFGDAVAHLHIARRILDSLNPGIRQIGSVWLPFPHLLMVPFAAKMSWWQSGIAGAIPSMACMYSSPGFSPKNIVAAAAPAGRSQYRESRHMPATAST